MSQRRIAERLGISVTTVSRALAGYEDVAGHTRARVAAEARRIGYVPNETARRLQSGRSGAVGVVVPAEPGRFDPFFLGMLASIGPLLAREGLALVMMSGRPGAEEMHAYRHLVEEHRVDGVLLARTRRRDPRIAYLLQSFVPFVAHGRTETRRAYAHLDIDGEAAFRMAAERLIGFGHRRIGLINAPGEYMFARHREAGWRRALAASALKPGPMLASDPTEEGGELAMRRLIASGDPPSAVLCATDRMAVGALAALAAARLRAGRDISLIGYDNLPIATYTDPPLTTIDQPLEAMAARLVEMLIALIGGASAAEFAEVRAPVLIPRASDGPVGGATQNQTQRYDRANREREGGDNARTIRSGPPERLH
ncbi:MAG TPA: substrate-binding domain-containing protein [Acetobacteraceae bacterium]|nr:substrate-binding domain-containing protein [Acetobacteraceae bacterium]